MLRLTMNENQEQHNDNAKADESTAVDLKHHGLATAARLPTFTFLVPLLGFLRLCLLGTAAREYLTATSREVIVGSKVLCGHECVECFERCVVGTRRREGLTTGWILDWKTSSNALADWQVVGISIDESLGLRSDHFRCIVTPHVSCWKRLDRAKCRGFMGWQPAASSVATVDWFSSDDTF